MGTKRAGRATENTAPRFIVYARISTVRQDVGLDVQLDTARPWVKEPLEK